MLTLMAWLRVECGVTANEFWGMTPATISALVTARKERIKREDYRAGIVTATVRGALGAKNIDVFDDFPEHKMKRPKAGGNLGSFFKTLIAHQKTSKPTR